MPRVIARRRAVTSPAAPALDSVLADRYVLASEIGRGGMASVYRARDRRHERDVAVKVLHPELAATVGTDRFLREIRLVARLQHPHILPLFDSGEVNGLLYFVMPFVDGESLRARLDRDGALTLDVAARLTRQLADALDYAHARGVVHRDIKPENVLLTGDQALLADFGIARGQPGGDATSATLTSVGIALGTPAYMSPEQALGDTGVDARSDVYALGCCCYEMLSGSPPFTGATAMALLTQHIATLPSPLIGAHAALPSGVADAVAKALNKEPDERFATAGDFVSAIERATVEARQPSGADLRIRATELADDAKQRVLVLAFTNIAQAADADWLSTGIAETVSADLSQIAGLKVLGQDAATRRRVEAAVGDRPLDVELATESGRSAGARWVVWGAFQKSGNRIRITPHFTDATTGTQHGGEKIDGMMDDIFALQDRIVLGLADALRIQLTSGEVERIERPETAHLGAYELYARGYREFVSFGRESIRLAAEHFRAAIAIDPDYALAHAGLGLIHGPMYIATGRREVLDDGARHLERAIALDPSLGEARAWLCYMAFRQGRFDFATQCGLTAVECDPTNDTTWYMLACSYLCRAVMEHTPAAIALCVKPALRAAELNPRNLHTLLVLAWTYTMRGQHSHAAPIVQRAMDLELTGASYAFFGARIASAILHLAEADIVGATRILSDAINAYSGSDHVYADTMTAYSYFLRACAAERTGELAAARVDFRRACEIADANPHRISIGAHWVKARYGLARVLHRTGDSEGAARMMAEGRALYDSHDRFIWTWFHGAADCEMLYEEASTLATMGRASEALAVLEAAGEAGWADVPSMRQDPAFTTLRDTPEMRRVTSIASGRVALPPPVGGGGIA